MGMGWRLVLRPTYDPNRNYFESNQFVAIIRRRTTGSFSNPSTGRGALQKGCYGVTAFLHIVLRSCAQLFIKTNTRGSGRREEKQQRDTTTYRIKEKSWQVEAFLVVLGCRCWRVLLANGFVAQPKTCENTLLCWMHSNMQQMKSNLSASLHFIASSRALV